MRFKNHFNRFILLGAFVGIFSLSCNKNDQQKYMMQGIEQLLDSLDNEEEFDRMLSLVDSLDRRRALSETQANYWRGMAYDGLGKWPETEEYLGKVINGDIYKKELLYYYRSANIVSDRLALLKHNYQKALEIAMVAVMTIEENLDTDLNEYDGLLYMIGLCQLQLGRIKEGGKTLSQVAANLDKKAVADSTGGIAKQRTIIYTNIIVVYENCGLYEEAERWGLMAENALVYYAAHPKADTIRVDRYKGRLSVLEAEILQKLGKPEEAAQAYETFKTTKFGKTAEGKLDATAYLQAAGRWSEAADFCMCLDSLIPLWYSRLTLGVLGGQLLNKYRCNLNAGRIDSAAAVSMKICNALDSAIVWQKQDKTMELATIYETNKKEMQIARQQAELSQQRWIATAVALVLLTIFFIVYTLNRRRHALHLEEKNVQLQQAHAELRTAYDQLEETTAQKERIESELRIARSIQMSMVPTKFPKREGLDMYATMTPAKEVGGDLYGYILKGDKLYFCVGDVSGKGVPASLFMSQATRLFRMLAAQGLMPDEICTQMNDALSGEDNKRSMFVTFFLGLVDLNTGHLYYCNAGHNAPLLGDNFMKMVPNMPIGMMPGVPYKSEEVDNIKGQTMFIYSDGLNEAMNKEKVLFGDDKLLTDYQSCQSESASQIIATLTTEVEKHRNGAEPNDDLTMMCLRLS